MYVSHWFQQNNTEQRKNASTQSLSNERPIFSTKFQQKVIYIFIIESSKNHKTAKKTNHSVPLRQTSISSTKFQQEFQYFYHWFQQINPTTQSLYDKQPISSTKFQQEFICIYHWFQQKAQNSEKTQQIRASPTKGQFSPQSFSRNLYNLSLIPAKTAKQQISPTSKSLSDKQPRSSRQFAQQFIYIYHWFQQKKHEKAKIF